MTKNWGNIIAGCMITIGLGTLVQVQAFARLKNDDARRLPLGEREYVIDSAERYSPVKIQGVSSNNSDHIAGKGVKILRDPVRPGEESKSNEVVPKKKQLKVEYRVVKGPSKSKQLRFDKIAVNGNSVEPRVKFDRAQLEIGRTEEATKGQFLQKISEVTNDW